MWWVVAFFSVWHQEFVTHTNKTEFGFRCNYISYNTSSNGPTNILSTWYIITAWGKSRSDICLHPKGLSFVEHRSSAESRKRSSQATMTNPAWLICKGLRSVRFLRTWDTTINVDEGMHWSFIKYHSQSRSLYCPCVLLIRRVLIKRNTTRLIGA